MANKKISEADFVAALKAIDEGRKHDEYILRMLLDETLNRKKRLLAVSAEMSGRRSYVTSVPLKWLGDAFFASDQPALQECRNGRDESGAVDKKTLDLLARRHPDWSRQAAATTRLVTGKQRKFPPVLLVAYQKWIWDRDHDMWAADGRALDDSVTRRELDSKGKLNDIDCDKTTFYALGGDMQLMAVRGLRNLLGDDLYAKKKEGTVAGRKRIGIDEMMRHDSECANDRGVFRTKLKSILDEKTGVEIIPAVQMGETREEAFAKLRRIFVNVNQSDG